MKLSEKNLACGGLNGNKLSHAAAVAENNGSGDTGVKGVIGAPADVFTGFEGCPALPDEDGAAGDDLAGKPLDAEPLGV